MVFFYSAVKLFGRRLPECHPQKRINSLINTPKKLFFLFLYTKKLTTIYILGYLFTRRRSSTLSWDFERPRVSSLSESRRDSSLSAEDRRLSACLSEDRRSSFLSEGMDMNLKQPYWVSDILDYFSDFFSRLAASSL